MNQRKAKSIRKMATDYAMKNEKFKPRSIYKQMKKMYNETARTLRNKL